MTFRKPQESGLESLDNKHVRKQVLVIGSPLLIVSEALIEEVHAVETNLDVARYLVLPVFDVGLEILQVATFEWMGPR